MWRIEKVPTMGVCVCVWCDKITLIEMIDDQLGMDRYWRRRSGNRTMGNLCRQQG